MKYKLRLLRPVNNTGRFGEKSTQWVEEGTVSAQLDKRTGRRTSQNAEIFSDYTVEYTIRRYRTSEIAEGWRVQQVGLPAVYTVVSIIPNLELGMVTLVCDRFND